MILICKGGIVVSRAANLGYILVHYELISFVFFWIKWGINSLPKSNTSNFNILQTSFFWISLKIFFHFNKKKSKWMHVICARNSRNGKFKNIQVICWMLFVTSWFYWYHFYLSSITDTCFSAICFYFEIEIIRIINKLWTF